MSDRSICCAGASCTSLADNRCSSGGNPLDHQLLGRTTNAGQLQIGEDVVRLWLKRFNAHGVAGLDDAPRSGRPTTYTADAIGVMVATALTDPKELDQAFGSWTFDRLAHYLHEQKGIAIKRSRIHEVLHAEGLRWREQESWFGARVDPDFAQKRGRSRPSLPSPLPAVS